jgi:serine/threonine protein kinase
MPSLTDMQWLQLSALLTEALDLPETGRHAWLGALRARDPQMASLVVRSLDARGSEGFSTFLSGLAPGLAETLTSATLTGRQIGAYVIDAEVGHGGMGSVWRAHRTDGRFDATVAIKFVHVSWIGKGGDQRFRQEGSVLARLSHPNIARILDAGVLDGSQPYLVLEYVEGESIDIYCEHLKLSARERIRVFLSVLQAVAHAHANLIVHRDIKPSNVLVTHEGVVKLLDFGIAKLLDDDPNSAPLTRMSAVALTPQYSAPEQLLGNPVTTATDVYALGLMLYLLLTGREPTATAGNSRADLIQAVLTTDPPRASLAASLPAIDGRSLVGDLDNILHKALKKAPAERYESAAAFAEDLRRYLESEPVRARPDTVAYRTRKFIARHRVGTALATVAVIALSASVVLSAAQARRAIAESARADEAARRAQEQRDLALEGVGEAQDLAQLTTFLLGEALPDDRPDFTGKVLLRGLNMVRAATTVPLSRRAAMLEEIGVRFENNRDYEHAAQVFGEAHRLALQGSDPGLKSLTACHLGLINADQGNVAAGASVINQALAGIPNEKRYANPRIVCYLAKSQVDRQAGKSEIEALETAKRYLADLMVPDWGLESVLLTILSGAYANEMRVPDALRTYARRQQILEQSGLIQSRDAVVLFSDQTVLAWKIGRPLDATRHLSRSQELNRERGTLNVDDTVALLLKARIAAQLGDNSGAVGGYGNAIQSARRQGDVPVENIALGEQVSALVKGSDYARAEQALAEAERILSTRLPHEHWIFGLLRMQSALLAEHRGDKGGAQRLADEAVALFESIPTRSYQFPIALVQRAGLEQRAGRYPAALADATRALKIYDRTFGDSVRSASVGDAWMAAGLASAATGDNQSARQRFAYAADHYESSLGPDHAKTQTARRAVRANVTEPNGN